MPARALIRLVLLLSLSAGTGGCASLLGGPTFREEPVRRTATLDVVSTPTGASVVLGDRWLGATPTRLRIPYTHRRQLWIHEGAILGYVLDVALIPAGIGLIGLIYDLAREGDVVREEGAPDRRTLALRIERDGYESRVVPVAIPGRTRLTVELPRATRLPDGLTRRPDAGDLEGVRYALLGDEGVAAAPGELAIGSPGIEVSIENLDAGFAEVRTTPCRLFVPPGAYTVRRLSPAGDPVRVDVSSSSVTRITLD